MKPVGYRPATIRSCVSQIETLLDTLDPQIHTVQPVRHVGILVLETANTLLYLTDVVPHIVDRAPDMAQMLKNNVIGLDHGMKIS
jgi:hypothetical protein